MAWNIDAARIGDELAAWRQELAAASIFLTRLPIRWRDDWPADLHARAQRAFPLIGLFIGLTGGVVYWLAWSIGLPPTPAAILAVTAQILLTGALHEDGLADVADGFGGGQDRARKLEIMRDSRIGSYGALALVLAVGSRVACIAALAGPGTVLGAMIAAGAVSRAAIPALNRGLDPARTDGVAATSGPPPADRVVTALLLGALIALLAVGIWPALLALLTGALVAAGFAALARRQIGGHTGDVLGGAQQLVEVAVLLAVAALV